jgi:hypothetical protein
MVDMQILHKMLNEKFTEENFEALLRLMDCLHDAAAVGELHTVSPLDAREVIGWLDDIIFTAEEVIRELQEQESANEGNGFSTN